ncbi:hypothetical protein WJX72_005458 [[Myrmecia] bisecta]|uniref:BTB domain-containing protein n=1 Tax=[Myrmecia] bisecta TaxID=41462 RepID=A0AAW1QF54_9CHLO
MDLFLAVKTGDLETVRYLVEVQAVSLQQHDAWNAPPLYYASLCGHEHLVRFLLSRGAKCEEKTYDGERCLYAALNDKIWRILIDEGFKRQAARGHDQYLEFLERCFDNPASFPDIEFTVQDTRVQAHRFLLAARSPYFGKLIARRWRNHRSVALFPDRVEPECLYALLRWFYTMRLEVPADELQSCIRLCKALKLHDLEEQLTEKAFSAAAIGDEYGSVVVEPMREDAKAQLQDAMEVAVAACCQRQADSEGTSSSGDYDLVLELGSRRYRCHRAFLCARSDYFGTMLNSSFREGVVDSEGSIQHVSMDDMDPQVLVSALRWVYTDRLDADLPGELLLQVMRFADRMIMEGLKNKCAVLLHPHIEQSTALPLLAEALQMDCDRLADSCIRCLAVHLLELVQEPLFTELVRDSIATVQNRQEFDSVPLIDDVRFHIGQLHGDGELSEDEDDDMGMPALADMPSATDGCVPEGAAAPSNGQLSMSERQQKLAALDQVLADIGIEA